MKILMVNKFLYPNGGSETYMLKLGEYLTSLGHQVEYFGMEHPDRCVGNSADCYTENMDFHNAGGLKRIKLSLKTIYSKEARQKIGKVIDTFQPDIVHLNNINFQLTPSIIYEIKSHNIPIVQTVHDVQIACPSHRMYNDQEQHICSLCFEGNYLNCVKTKCVHGSMLKSLLATCESYYYHRKDTYNLVDCYICPSKFMADVIVKGGVRKEKIQVMHNYCNRQKSLPQKDKSKKYVLYFGRLSVEKGIKTLVQVCKELPDIQFIFAGTGPLAEMCDGVDNIDAVGFKSGQELKSLISNALFSVCPSECNDNCPMSVIESLSMGTPVICSNLGGAPELVEPHITGEVFKAGDITDLKEKILLLHNDEKLLDQMSRQCFELSTNTVEKYAEKLTDIYEKLLKCRG